MKILKDITDAEFVARFKSSNADDKVVMKVMFREWLQNRPHLEIAKNLDNSFKKLASEILPEILKTTIKSKNSLDGTMKVRAKDIIEKMPYLVRQPNSEKAIGMVRFDKAEYNEDSKEWICEPLDVIIFDHTNEVDGEPEVFEKFDVEKKQMFSVVYRNYDAWNDKDTDGDFAENEDLRKAVIHVAKNGIGMNIQHDNSQPVTADDAMVIEFYQSRSSFIEEGLQVRKGDLVATTQFFDTDRGNQLWNDMKSGKYTTYSMEGVSQ